MTKQQEIKALDAMIKMFGEESYIGPWLSGQRANIIYCINNDFLVRCPVCKTTLE